MIKVLLSKYWRTCLMAVVLLVSVGTVLISGSTDVEAALNNLPGTQGVSLTTKEMRELVGGGLTGNYPEDVKKVVVSMRSALASTATEKKAAQTDARYKINAFTARYRRDPFRNMASFTTLRTALNTLATYYNGRVRRDVPQKVKDRVLAELAKAETALAEGL